MLFTERDGLLLFGHPREKVFTPSMAPVRRVALGRVGNVMPVSVCSRYVPGGKFWETLNNYRKR